MNQETNDIYYIETLKGHLETKQSENPAYSLRALARDLDLHSSTLSQIIRGKRKLPFKKAKSISKKLELSPKEHTLFMESFHRSKTSIDNIEIEKLDRRFLLDESYGKVIAEWEHYAVLDLFDLTGFEVNLESICKKLKISKTRAKEVINNLLQAGLLSVNQFGEYGKAHPDIKTTEDITNQALQKSHLETLDIGKQKLKDIEVELRDFSATTVALDLEKLPEAKTIIREFRQKMSALLRDGNKTDIYQLAIQFYPLSEIEKNLKEKLL